MTQPVIRCPAKSLVIDRENAHCAYYLARVPVEHTIDDVKSPDYFGLRQGRNFLRVGDIITVQPEDFAWHLELIVRVAEDTVHKVETVVLNERFFETDYDLPEGWEIEWRGDMGKHVVSKDSVDKESGFETLEAAVKAVDRLSKTRETLTVKKPVRKAAAKKVTEAA